MSAASSAVTTTTTGKFGVQLDYARYREDFAQDLKAITKFRRVTDFLSATQLYLKRNFLLREPLTDDDIKDRLLGHWGTCPGINFVYAHCNYLVKKHDLDMMLIVGPGHGAPAILSNLYVEGTLAKYYPQYEPNEKGIGLLVKGFSWPGGFPSHANAQLPGTIHEGGELGYALATAFGAVMDDPDCICTVIVGDGECETGPTAAAWHSYKYIDPKVDGAVLPIIHLNGFKISSRTIYGMMSDEDLVNLFTGYGYVVRIVQDMRDMEADMAASMEWALAEIRKIQGAARRGQPIFKPRWPLIILRSPKGWGGVKTLGGKQIEGSFRSHGIPVKDPKTNYESFKAVAEWFRSYRIEELVDEKGAVLPEILDAVLPPEHRRIGNNPKTNRPFRPLNMPDIRDFAVKPTENYGEFNESNTKIASNFLAEVIRLNPHSFRIFSPDELESNRLTGVFKVTHRNYQWDEAEANSGGQLLEILSEHTCQGWLQGYILTGRFALFPSYETFLGIITTMMQQWAKFIKIANETLWRNPVPSINYIETSTLWRQEHNGFSHQNPMFINNMINMKANTIRIYLPPDANCVLSTLRHCLNSKNYVNLIISSKQETPVWLNMEEAERHCMAGASVWKWCSTDGGVDPDVVLVGCGTEVTTEVVQAAYLLRRDCPELRVRVVNLTDLMILDRDFRHPHGLSEDTFHALFTEDKPVIFNFHGYPSVIKQLLFERPNNHRFEIHGYMEEGTTTTPFKMLTANRTSRYHLAISALHKASKYNKRVAVVAGEWIAYYNHKLRVHDKYIAEFGKDPDDLNNFDDTILGTEKQQQHLHMPLPASKTA